MLGCSSMGSTSWNELPITLKHWLFSYLNNRQIKIKLNQEITSAFIPQAGVPQGSSLSATLYIIYMNKIPIIQNPFNNFKSQYADDTCLWSRAGNTTLAAKNIQENLDNLKKYCDQWRVQINTEKAYAITFQRIQKKTNKTVLGKHPS